MKEEDWRGYFLSFVLFSFFFCSPATLGCCRIKPFFEFLFTGWCFYAPLIFCVNSPLYHHISSRKQRFGSALNGIGDTSLKSLLKDGCDFLQVVAAVHKGWILLFVFFLVSSSSTFKRRRRITFVP